MENLVFLGLNVHAWITLITVFGIFVVMARTRIPAVVVFLGAFTVLLLFGVVPEEDGMAGFGSEPVVVHGGSGDGSLTHSECPKFTAVTSYIKADRPIRLLSPHLWYAAHKGCSCTAQTS